MMSGEHPSSGGGEFAASVCPPHIRQNTELVTYKMRNSSPSGLRGMLGCLHEESRGGCAPRLPLRLSRIS